MHANQNIEIEIEIGLGLVIHEIYVFKKHTVLLNFIHAILFIDVSMELVQHPKTLCTPHLGASTTEAQLRVAREIAEQFVDAINGKPMVGLVSILYNISQILKYFKIFKIHLKFIFNKKSSEFLL